jgi:L-cysteine/cystine lyase
MPEDVKLAAVRAGLPSLAAGIQLNTGSVGPLPAETAAAMAELTERELAVGRAHPADAAEFLQRLDEARAAMAAVVTCDVDSIALTRAATDGMNLATWAADWAAGDRAVTTMHEHPGGLGALYAVRDRYDVDLAFADVGDGGDDEATLAAFDRAIVPGTRLVALSHVLWTTGARLPVREIVELAHRRGALVVVDGAQAVGAIAVDVGALGVDAYAIAGQKWLLGPEGTGGLYVAPGFIDRARLTFGGWFSFERIDSAGTAEPHRDARRFQVAGYHRPSVLGLARSVSWLSMYVGLDWIQRRGATLARAAADRLSAIPGVRVLTPRQRMATLVTFGIDGWTAEAALEELAARAFVVARTIPALDAIRISVGFFNTEAEVERVAELVALLAAHTPATVPPRRTLAMLGTDG